MISRFQNQSKDFYKVSCFLGFKDIHRLQKEINSVTENFQYLFLLIFYISIYMNLITYHNTPAFAKDTVYHFVKMIQINWIRFTTILSSKIIRDAIIPPDSEDRANVLIIDDSMFERNRFKKGGAPCKSL